MSPGDTGAGRFATAKVVSSSQVKVNKLVATTAPLIFTAVTVPPPFAGSVHTSTCFGFTLTISIGTVLVVIVTVPLVVQPLA